MEQVKVIMPEELRTRLASNDPTLQVVDVREDEEVEIGKISEAIHIRLNDIPNRMDELDKTKTLVMVCRSGRRSECAVKFLQSQGYDVLNMEGGMLNWSREVFC